MEKRKFNRIPVTLNATVLSDGRQYTGMIGNVSEEGLAHTIITFVNTSQGFVPRGAMEIILRIPTGIMVSLHCEVRWFVNPSPDRHSLIIGLKIVDPPADYIGWVRQLDNPHAPRAAPSSGNEP